MPRPGVDGRFISPFASGRRWVSLMSQATDFGTKGYSQLHGLSARIGLQRCGERQMRGEGMIDIGHAALHSIIGNALGRAYAANAAAIDLHVGDLAVVDKLAGHVEIMRGFAAGNADLAAAGSQCAIGIIGAAEKRLFKPDCVDRFKQGDAGSGCLHILTEYLARIDEQGSVLA